MLSTDHSWTRKTLGAKATLLVVLWSLLFSQFSATTHQLAVQHATCLQHGEVVDVAGGVAQVESAPQAQSSQFSGTADSTSQTQHQHCPFVSSRVSHKIFKLQPANAVELPTLVEQVQSSLAYVPHITPAVYLTAPKHSPPAV
jgi:hypothetical protein